MTLRWYAKLNDAWAQSPTADWFIANYFGYKPPAKLQTRASSDPGNMRDLAAMFGVDLAAAKRGERQSRTF